MRDWKLVLNMVEVEVMFLFWGGFVFGPAFANAATHYLVEKLETRILKWNGRRGVSGLCLMEGRR